MTAGAELRLPGAFGDGMVLQADRPAAVWGWAEPGERVSVTIDGHTASTEAGPDGRWRVALPAHEPGGPFTMTVTGSTTLTLRDILYGQVWLNAGQSNMYWPVRLCDNAREEIAAVDHPRIRLFVVERSASWDPQEDVAGEWVTARPETVRHFSGTAWFFGRELHERIDQPVGLIVSAVGNTRINLWLAHEAIRDDPDYGLMAARDRAQRIVHEATVAARERDQALWHRLREQASAAGEPEPVPPPAPPASPIDNNDALGTRYHAMVHGLGPMTLAGVTWYQGESNVDRAVQYHRLLPALIGHWRSRFENPELPFLIVQLPNMHRPVEPPGNSLWAELRAAQAATAANDPHVGLAVTIDLGGDPPVIHPTNKQDVGDRLARRALAMVHGRDVVASGPTFRSMTIEGETVRVTFDHVGEGLVTRDGEPPRAFTVAAAPDAFHRAEAVIDGDSVVLSCPEVPAPVAVRYAWANEPEVNLFGASGLPVAPFRTDDWPLSTRYNH